MNDYQKERLGIIRINARKAASGYLDIGIQNPYSKNTPEYKAFESGISDAYKEQGI